MTSSYPTPGIFALRYKNVTDQNIHPPIEATFLLSYYGISSKIRFDYDLKIIALICKT